MTDILDIIEETDTETPIEPMEVPSTQSVSYVQKSESTDASENPEQPSPMNAPDESTIENNVIDSTKADKAVTNIPVAESLVSDNQIPENPSGTDSIPIESSQETGNSYEVPAESPLEFNPMHEPTAPNFLPYNTDMVQMVLPEYGRKIHELIQYCKMLPSKEERTACAYSIAEVMERLFPTVGGQDENHKTIWDHINIMADFDLDIDFPVEVISKEKLHPKPEKLEYPRTPIKYRYYGRTLELMIDKAVRMEESPEREQLVLLIANQMKKQLLAHNREGVSDAKVLKDLSEYTKGKIHLDPRDYPLHEYNEYIVKTPAKKKKKKQ